MSNIVEKIVQYLYNNSVISLVHYEGYIIMLEKKRINWIDIANGIAISLIAIFHISQNKYINTVIISFALPTFAFISGYLFKPKGIKENFKRRIITLIVPYLIIGTLELIYYWLFECRFREHTCNFLQSVLGLLSGYYDWLEFNVHLWYLPFFFMLTNLYNFLYVKLNKNVARLSFIILAILGCFVDIPNLPLSINRVELFMYYAMGEILQNKIKLIDQSKKGFKFLIMFCCAIAFAGMTYFNFTWNVLGFIRAFLGIFVIIIISKMIEDKDFIFKKLGKESLIILCVHGPIYRILIKLMSVIIGVDSNAIRNTGHFCLIVVVLDLLISYGLSLMFKNIITFKNRARKEVEE